MSSVCLRITVFQFPYRCVYSACQFIASSCFLFTFTVDLLFAKPPGVDIVDMAKNKKNKKSQGEVEDVQDINEAVDNDVQEVQDSKDVQDEVNEVQDEVHDGQDTQEEANGSLQSKIAQLTLESSNAIEERDKIQQLYDSLMGKLILMKSLFTNMKKTETELELANEVNKNLQDEIERLEKENKSLTISSESAQDSKKLTTRIELLNNECERLSKSLNKSTKEYEFTIEELTNDKYQLENQNAKLNRRVNEYKVELSEFHLVQDEVNSENSNLLLKIEELTQIIEDKELTIAEGTKIKTTLERNVNNLKEELLLYKKTKEEEIDELKVKISQHDDSSKELHNQLETSLSEISALNEELSKSDQLKSELHNKQLQIGKLRHEAIILNEHLTKSLSMLKQNNNKNTIDKQLISNILISFLQFPRGDTKKFESLQLISALLEWDESQKVLAGLSNEHEGDLQRQSFASLWTDFLEKESTSK